MKLKQVLTICFCVGASFALAKDAPLAPAWKVRNSTGQPIQVKAFFKSKQPKFNDTEQSHVPVTINPGAEHVIDLGGITNLTFYYTPSRIEIVASPHTLNWIAPQEAYYDLTVELKNNKLEVKPQNWSFNEILKRKAQIKQDAPHRDKYYYDTFKPQLDKYLKTH